MKSVIIVGASGHGKVVADIIQKAGDKVYGFLDDNTELNDTFLGFPILGTIDCYKEYRDIAEFVIDCIEQMIKYRFEITMTEKCLRYIIDEYSKLENQELKEDFMCKWIDCLTLAESKGNVYKEVYAQNMMRVCQDIIREEYEVLNPVWRNYFSLCVKYKCGLETK